MAALRQGKADLGTERVFGKVMAVLGDLSALNNNMEWEAEVNSLLMDFGGAITKYKRDVAPNAHGQRYPLRRRR